MNTTEPTFQELGVSITTAYGAVHAAARAAFDAKENTLDSAAILETAKAQALAAKGGDIKSFGTNEAAQKAALLAACPDEVELLRAAQKLERQACFNLSEAEASLEEVRAILRLAEVVVGIERQKRDLH